MLDVNLRRALIRTDADLTPFFTRPISLILLAVTLLTIVARVGWFQRLIAIGSARVKTAFSRR
jgi:putative tricarboxylic transport membrane protein